MSKKKKQQKKKRKKITQNRIKISNPGLKNKTPLDTELDNFRHAIKAYSSTQDTDNFCDKCALFLRKLAFDNRDNEKLINEKIGIKLHSIRPLEVEKVMKSVATNNIANAKIVETLKTGLEIINPPHESENIIEISQEIDYPINGLYKISINGALIDHSNLFDIRTHPNLSVEKWQNQDILELNGEKITLFEIVRSVIIDAVHPVPEETLSDKLKLLKSIYVLNLAYEKLITMETAFYLFYILTDKREKPQLIFNTDSKDKPKEIIGLRMHFDTSIKLTFNTTGSIGTRKVTDEIENISQNSLSIKNISYKNPNFAAWFKKKFL